MICRQTKWNTNWPIVSPLHHFLAFRHNLFIFSLWGEESVYEWEGLQWLHWLIQSLLWNVIYTQPSKFNEWAHNEKADLFAFYIIFLSVFRFFRLKHLWNLQKQTHFSSSVIGTIKFYTLCLNAVDFLICVYSEERLISGKQSQPLIMSGVKSLNLPVSRQRLENLYGNIYSQWHTVCAGVPQALAVVRPSKMVSQRDMKEVSLFLKEKNSHTHTTPCKCKHKQYALPLSKSMPDDWLNLN